MQFLDMVLACPSWCNDRCVGPDSAKTVWRSAVQLGHGVVRAVVQRRLSLLVGVQYIDKLLMCLCDVLAGSLHDAFLCATSGSIVNTCSATAPGCVGRIVLIFFVKVNSDPEVVSVLLSSTLNGECAQSKIQLPSEPMVALGKWSVFLRAFCIWQFCVRWSGVA